MRVTEACSSGSMCVSRGKGASDSEDVMGLILSVLKGCWEGRVYAYL